MAVVALLSPGIRAEFSPISAVEMQERARSWGSPSPDNSMDSGESDSDSEQQEKDLMEPFDGVLHEEMVSEGLSVLGRSASGTEQVYLNLHLSVVNLSFNQITNMKDLSAYTALTTLLLNNNDIEEINGLEKCTSLTHLNLAHNRIRNICGFGNLPLKELNLASNQIKTISGLQNLKRLQALDLSSNQISSLEGLEELEVMQTLNLQDNEICQISEIAFIEHLPLLHALNLLRNPLQEQAEYWLSVLFMLQRLTELDTKQIKVDEKVAAVNKYDPPPEVIAARDHMANVMYSMIQPQKIFDSTLPNLDTPYPMLVLTGPQSSGKRELAHRMCREFKEFFRYGPCHTTRNPYFGEEKRFDYHFVTPEMFEDMMCSGQFLLTMTYSGHYYGLSREAVESVAREGLACCTHVEIEGVRSLKNSHFKPRYILLLPMNKEKYEGWLRRKGIFTRPEIDFAVSRVDTYIKIHQDCPGYFDAVINTDDLDEAYSKLRLLVKEYLGLTEPVQSNESVTREKSGTDSGKSLTGSFPNEAYKVSQNITTNEFQDSAARNYSARVSAKVSPQKTPAEEASVQRRQEAARQALAGKTAGTYTQLFQRGTVTAPATLGTHRRLLDPASCSSIKPSGSNVTADHGLPPASPETSSRDSRPSSGLSLLSSAGAFSARRSSSQTTPVINIQGPPEDKVEPLDLSGIGQEPDTLSGDQKSVGNTPDPPRMPSSTRSDGRTSKSSSSLLSARSSWPGSNTKPILPPIPSGRKKSPR
ncbi:leucine-rich repeat and guanylate kinase domain-containing protein isoform X2 [Hyperolius riggenbachi]|uniref:leucine-rich repeat and guanylate kinase domain-containing protein isoform X2 n=1 Tax=Hyperolius riggenbachi TaxID=752182 RepID=UPI0035A3D2F8